MRDPGPILVHRPLLRAQRALLFLSCLIPPAPGGVRALAAQDLATLTVEENLRAEPQGVVIGRLSRGAGFPVMEIDGRWVLVEVEGWMWTPSLEKTDRVGFDLAVSASPRENLRVEPQGAIIARLLEGALLERVEEIPGWTLVRRVAWVWGSSVEIAATGPAGDETRRGPTAVPAGAQEWWRSGPRGAPILTAPDGDTLARAGPDTELRVLAREGNWVRVRLEGWSWAPEGEAGDTLVASSVSDLSLEDVIRDPELYRGRVVSWELQFVSLEHAEKVRTDFYEGEPFLLARAVDPGARFVYVAVPPERMEDVEGLNPLERVRVVGRIRTGAAALTGNPILDLLDITRIPRR